MRRFLPILFLVPAMAAGQSSLHIEAEGATARVSGLGRGAEVSWMASLHEDVRDTYFQITTTDGVAVDKDGDGVIEIVFDRPIPRRAAILVVDQSTGESATLLPPQGPTPDFPPEDRQRRRPMNLRTTGDAEGFELDRGQADLLMVRPGLGSWKLTMVDGDSDGLSLSRKGHTTVRLASLSARRGKEPPERLSPGDRIYALDPMRLEISILELD